MSYAPSPDAASAVEAACESRRGHRRGDEITFLCPAHEDTNPSASYNVASHVWTCYACGEHGGFLDLAKRLGVDLPHSNGRVNGTAAGFLGDVVATYDYRDASGSLVYQAVRFRPKAFRQRRPDGAGGWIWNLTGVTRVLYRLPELLAADPAATVFVVEGEKDVHALTDLGFVATTNAGGAGKWHAAYSGALRDRDVVIIPDNDEAGERHAETVAASLRGIAAQVRVLRLPGIPPKGDVSNWIERGGQAESLLYLADRTPPESDLGAEPPDDGTSSPPKPPSAGESYALTDTGNAERLVARHGANLRYCTKRKKWLHWDGQRWRFDHSGQVERYSKETARSIYEEAAREPDDEKRKAIVKHARQTEGGRARAAMISLAQSEEGMSVDPDELDADPWLLNVANGTIDLRTGELRPHNRSDLLTKLSPVSFDPDARLELWDHFLDESTGSDAQLVAFLRRATGYSLTADISEEKLFFVHGPSATGKSTFLEAVKATLGDYATTADFEAFLARRDPGGPRNDIARLAGARAVISIEVDQGKKLAEGLVKMLTGGDTVSARFLYEESFEFYPGFKLWLAANHAPAVSDEDAAMWRRILRIPFDRVVEKTKRDRSVKARLKDPAIGGPAILAWAVKGCLAWQSEGLGVPPVVEKATEEYRGDMDLLREFLSDCCELKPGATVVASNLRQAYERWSKESEDKVAVSGKAWGERLRAKGCKRDVVKQAGKAARVWRGIRLLDEPETLEMDLDGPAVDPVTGSGRLPVVTDKWGNFGGVPPHEGGLAEIEVTTGNQDEPVTGDVGQPQAKTGSGYRLCVVPGCDVIAFPGLDVCPTHYHLRGEATR